MFSQLYERLERENLVPSLTNALKVLDGDDKLAAINRHLIVPYKTDQDLISKLDRETKIDIG